MRPNAYFVWQLLKPENTGEIMDAQVNKILFCTDLSSNSQKTFKYALNISKLFTAKLHVLYVMEKISKEQMIAMRMYATNSVEDMQNKHMDFGKQEFATYQTDFWQSMPKENQALKENIESATIVQGYPAESILKHSKKINCDLIVMGTNRKGIQHNFLGTVAKSVLRRSEIPTLIVPITGK